MDDMFLRLMANPSKIKTGYEETIDDIFIFPLKKLIDKYPIDPSNYKSILTKIENMLQEYTIQLVLNNIITTIEDGSNNQTDYK